VPSTGQDEALASADYDNDGAPDIFSACGGFLTACANALWRNDGLDEDGRLVHTDVTDEAGMGGTAVASFGASWADHDNDGWLDLYMSTRWTADPCACEAAQPPTYPGSNLLCRNLGDGTFEEVGEQAGVANEADCHQAAWHDYDEDGDQDLGLVEAGLSDLQALVTTLQDGLSTLESEVAALSSVDLMDLLATVTDHEGRIAAIETAPYATEAWVAAQGYAARSTLSALSARCRR